MPDKGDKAKYNPGEPTTNYLTEKEMDIQADLKAKKLESGWLGHVFGTKTAPTNIAGIAVVIVLIAGLISFSQGADTAKQTWSILAPIITMVLGFVFGKSKA